MEKYEAPRIVDYGDIKEITETNLRKRVTDVPQGTEAPEGTPIIGSNF